MKRQFGTIYDYTLNEGDILLLQESLNLKNHIVTVTLTDANNNVKDKMTYEGRDIIPYSTMAAAHGMSSKSMHRKGLGFNPDGSAKYEASHWTEKNVDPLLNEAYSGSDMINYYSVSWGDYRVRGNKIVFQDRVAGFKMEAAAEADGFRFCKDYFPDIKQYVWNIEHVENYSGEEDEEINYSIFTVTFDKEKAKSYRKKYRRENKRPFEFSHEGYGVLTIEENGNWKKCFSDDFVLASGTWRRKGNVLILNCPKLRCNFYMLIAEDKLISMLLLGDTYGSYYMTESQLHRLYGASVE